MNLSRAAFSQKARPMHLKPKSPAYRGGVRLTAQFSEVFARKIKKTSVATSDKCLLVDGQTQKVRMGILVDQRDDLVEVRLILHRHRYLEVKQIKK